MQLVDHHILKRDVDICEIRPVEHILHHARVVGRVRGRALAPAALAGHRTSIWVEQIFGLVKQQAARGVIRPIHAIGIFKLRDVQPEYDHRPGVADAKTVGEWQHGIWVLLGAVKQAQFTAGRADRVDGEAHTAGHDRCAVDQKQAGTHRVTLDLLGRMQPAVGLGREYDFLTGHTHSSFLQNRTALFQA